MLETVVRALIIFSDARTLTDLMELQSRRASFAAFGIVLVVFGALLEVVAVERFIQYIEPPGDRSDQTTVETHHRERLPVAASASMTETAAAVNLWELESREEPLKSVL